jgi:hypothetical protein
MIVCVAYAFFLVFSQYRFLSSNDADISKHYDSVAMFFITWDSLLKFFLRRVVKIRKLFSHYAVLSFLKFLDILQNQMQRLYTFIRGYFVKKSIENKSLVVHFWDHLKHYKREIDSEEENNN